MALDRSGIFISHAHEDAELAAALCTMLKTALSLGDADITCTSDATYGLDYGKDLRSEIEHRLDAVGALFLLASPAAQKRAWVQHEAGYAASAAAREALKFYVVVAVPSHREAVPEPYRGNVAVTLIDGKAVRAFVRQLQRDFLKDSTPSTDIFDAELGVVEECATISMKEAHARLASVERERDQFKKDLGHVKAQRAWVAAVAVLTAVAISYGSYEWSRQRYETRFMAETDKLRDESSAEMNKVIEQRDEQQRSWPFSGLVLDRSDRVVRCTEVRAHSRNRKVGTLAKCDKEGQFNFRDGLGVLPDEPFSLTVVVGGDELDPGPRTRREVPAAIYTRTGTGGK